MQTSILMPALSPTMTAGTLARWLKREGEAVSAGDVLAEIETDKATMEFEAADDGVLERILVPEGTANVAVNAPIALLMTNGAAIAAPVAAAGGTRDRRMRVAPRRKLRRRPGFLHRRWRAGLRPRRELICER